MVMVVVVIVAAIVAGLYEDVTSVELNKENIRLSYKEKTTVCARERASLCEQGKTSYIAV